MKALIIDGDDESSALAARSLTARGYQCSIIPDGELGLKLAALATHDVIILDIQLPGLSGLEIIRRLREHRNMTPVIVVSALSESDDKVVGLNLGADDYLTERAPRARQRRLAPHLFAYISKDPHTRAVHRHSGDDRLLSKAKSHSHLARVQGPRISRPQRRTNPHHQDDFPRSLATRNSAAGKGRGDKSLAPEKETCSRRRQRVHPHGSGLRVCSQMNVSDRLHSRPLA